MTKRGILSQSGGIFDLLGLITQYAVILKIFLSKALIYKGGSRFSYNTSCSINFRNYLMKLKHFSFPRCLIYNSCNTFERHGFYGTSMLAYAAASYCKQTHDNKTNISFLVSRTTNIHPQVRALQGLFIF